MAQKRMRILRSDSKGGQGLKARADDSKGSRKKELLKLERVDQENFAKLDPAMQAKIKRQMSEAAKKKTMRKNQGEFL